LQHLNSLSKSQIDGVIELISAAAAQDGTPPISEHIILHLRHGGDKSDSHLIMEQENKVIAYAHIDATDLVAGPSVELVVHPDHRKSGLGKELLSKSKEICGTKMRLWAHGDLSAAQKLADENGFERIRTVIQMRKSLADLSANQHNFAIRTFLPGLDNEEWLVLNNKVFENHPEQGAWSLKDLQTRLAESWFDPAGFFVATQNNKLIGFTWTKIHGGHSHKHDDQTEQHDHDPIGEIYITAVATSGTGLGKVLTQTALAYLKANGLITAMLYVDSDNEVALNLYKSLGFAQSSQDVMYRVR
jgi:mycothiol synthase